MSEVPRLNGVIGVLEQGKPTFVTFASADVESAIAISGSKYDGVVYEMEHNPWDARALRDCLQYMLNRRQIAQRGSVAPAVTPMVRIPPNGGEHNQWLAKQALDLGVYGIVWPHVSTVDQARNAVAACRYPRLKSAPLYEPNEDGTGLEQITYDKVFDSFPMFSPDGRRIIFSSNRNNNGTRDTNLFVAEWVD